MTHGTGDGMQRELFGQEPVRLGRPYLTTSVSFIALVGREKLRRDQAGPDQAGPDKVKVGERA